MKKSVVLFLSLLLTVGAMTACSDNSSTTNSNTTSGTSQTSSAASQQSADKTSSADTSSGTESSAQTSAEQTSTTDNTQQFADSDTKDVTGESANATITLSGSSATLSDTTRGSFADGVLTITSKGIYRVSGSSENISIQIDDSTKSGNVYLILDNVTMTNTTNPCIDVQNSDKVIIQTVGTCSLTYQNTDTSAKKDGAVYAKDDVTINGSGTLNITSSLHGIVAKNDLKITNTTLNLQADKIGIQAGDSVRISGGTITLTSGHDGIQIANDDNTAFFYYADADMTITSGYDGISVKSGDDSKTFTGNVTLQGGELRVTTASGEGASQSKNSSTSQKGIKTDGDITIKDTALTVSAADDAIHGNANIVIESGAVVVSSSDDGITASGDLTINGGTVNVLQSYEGLEAANITINDGNISVTASDDGLNCAGGSDTSSQDDRPWGGNTDATLTINGGNVYVNASGDGLDSNGSIYITGGTTIVEGSTNGGNGALDKGDSNGCVASITGGTILAIGTSDMAVNFDTGTQCSALVSLSGNAGDTITVDDGSGFSFTTSKNFACAVYSSPSLTQGNTYTMTAGSNTAALDFTSSLYYSTIQGMGGRGGFPGGMR
ncbi:MAG: carbohydrate-binding domain-containing protein [Acutalibacteraceae bacterium]|nr:carbohydrate-binding domain-containing protein [Acutalibacteraceae bacterium]